MNNFEAFQCVCHITAGHSMGKTVIRIVIRPIYRLSQSVRVPTDPCKSSANYSTDFSQKTYESTFPGQHKPVLFRSKEIALHSLLERKILVKHELRFSMSNVILISVHMKKPTERQHLLNTTCVCPEGQG